MDEKIDDSIDRDTGLKFNPIDENTALPIIKGIHQAGVPVTPPEQISGIPTGSGDAPYIFGSQVDVKGEKEQEGPGYISTALHTAWDMSIPHTAWNLGSTFYNDIADHSEVPEGWNPLQKKQYFENTPEKYWHSLAMASSPKRQEQIYQEAIEEMKTDAYYSKGPFASKLIGGLAGYFGSGASFIKVAGYSKYSTMPETFLRNAQAALPGLAAQAIEMAGVEQLGRAATDAEEFGIQALQGLAFSSLLHVGGITFNELKHNKALHDAKDVISSQNDGVSFEPVLSESGEILHYKAVANGEKSVGAAELKQHEQFINAKINESILMKSKTFKNLAGNRALGSTLVRMKQSRFATSAQYIETMVKNRFSTVGEKKGIASQITASEYHQEIQNNGYQLSNKVNALYFKAIGLKEANTSTQKFRSMFLNKEDSSYVTKRKFGQQVRDAIEGDKPSQIPEVNTAATEIRQFMHETNKTLGKAMGLNDVAFVSPKNFFDYFPHTFDHEAIKLDALSKDGGRFINDTVAHLEQQDTKILNLLQSHENFQSLIQTRQRALLEHLKSKMRDDEFFKDRALTGDKTEHLEVKPDRAFKEETNALNHEIDALKKSIAEIEGERKAFWDSILEDPTNNHLLVDGEFMTKETRDLGSKWLSEYSNLETLVDTLKSRSRSEVKSSRKAASKAEEAIYRQSTSKGRNKAQQEFREKEYAANWIEKELDKALTDAQKKLSTERTRLENAARDGSMPRILYHLIGDNKIEFINPNRAPELKQHFESHGHRISWAMQKRDRILGLTDEMIKSDLFGGMGKHTEQTAFLKNRDRTIPYHIYNDAGFFSADIGETINSYANSVGKRIGILQAFKENPHLQKPEDVASLLLNEYNDHLESIRKIEDPKKRKAELKSLTKDYDIAKNDINGIHNAYMGTDGSEAAKGFNKAFSMYASSAFMGGLPISMISDVGQQVMRHGIGNYLATGLVLLLKTLNGHLKTKDARSMAGYASDAGVAMNVLKARVHLNQLDVNGDSSVHVGNWFSRMMSFSGNATGQITLANYITDTFHTMTAYMAQSRIMRNMHDFLKDGKINQRETEYMAALGIDTKKYAQRFVDQFNKYGRKDGKLGYHSEHTRWDDLDAYDTMRRAIFRDVQSTHFEGTKFDAPLWTSNPVGKAIFTFNSWAFAAFNNITVPILQGPDGRKAFGMTLMVALGILQEPMRAYINNREYKIPGVKELATIGLLNSGILGQFANAFNLGNVALGGKFLPGFLPQKYHDIGLSGALMGVPGSVADMIAGISRDFYTGMITQKTVKDMTRLMPFLGIWEIRRLTNAIGQQLGENAGLPKNARGATGWGWWEAMNENKD